MNLSCPTLNFSASESEYPRRQHSCLRLHYNLYPLDLKKKGAGQESKRLKYFFVIIGIMNEQSENIPPKPVLSTSATPPVIDAVKPPLPTGNNASETNVWQQLKPIVSVVTFVVGVVITATLINAFVFQSYFVEGTSMTPTLHNHDRLIIDKFSRSFSFVQGKPYVPGRGQIAILDSTLRDRQGQPEQLIKRVIGLPGERVVIQNGIVTIYNHDFPAGFDADKTLGLNLGPAFTSEPVDIMLGETEIYVIGDNRSPGGSLDSRSFGPVDIKNIEGRLWARIFPFGDMRTF